MTSALRRAREIVAEKVPARSQQQQAEERAPDDQCRDLEVAHDLLPVPPDDVPEIGERYLQ